MVNSLNAIQTLYIYYSLHTTNTLSLSLSLSLYTNAQSRTMVSASAPSPLVQPSSPRISLKRSISLPAPSSVGFRPPYISAAYASAERTRSPCLSPPPKLDSYRASLYEVLGIPVVASGEEIKSAYRRLARICHPDVAEIDRRNSSADEFMKLHDAYSTLSDPVKRADYDRRLLPRHRTFRSYSTLSATQTTAMPRFSGYTCRNWETDQCW